jgi:hypothetical protein
MSVKLYHVQRRHTEFSVSQRGLISQGLCETTSATMPPCPLQTCSGLFVVHIHAGAACTTCTA